MKSIFTPEHLEFLRNHIVGRSKKELAELFNQHFQMNVTDKQIRACCKNHKLPPSGLTGRFEKGRVPFNKGMKGVDWGSKETQFKKGHIPKCYRPIGSERVNADGYVEIKITGPDKWKMKHTYVWEQTNGVIPEGHAVIFGDGNRFNFDLNNLLLVSRRQLLFLNRKHLIQNDAELTRVGLVIADIHQKISERRMGAD